MAGVGYQQIWTCKNVIYTLLLLLGSARLGSACQENGIPKNSALEILLLPNSYCSEWSLPRSFGGLLFLTDPLTFFTYSQFQLGLTLFCFRGFRLDSELIGKTCSEATSQRRLFRSTVVMCGLKGELFAPHHPSVVALV